MAGKGAGITGEKSGLWKEMSRVICEVQPQFAFMENSSILTSRGLGVVLGDLAQMGYDARWCVLGADDAGAPHQRKRIWILAYTNGKRLQGKNKPSKQNEKWKAQTIKRREIIRQNIEWWDIDPADLPDTNQFDDDMGGRGASEIFESEATEVSGCKISDSMQTGLQTERTKQQTTRITGNDSQTNLSDTGRKRSDKGNSKEMEEKKKERSPCLLHDQSSSKGYGTGENWPAQSRVGRVVNGMAHRVDRVKAIGNGQVPAVAALAFIILSEGLI